MKKLIPMMAVAAVAFGAFADKAPIKSQGFDAVTEGAVEDLDALTKSDADLVWSTTDKDATLTVAAYDTTKETPYTYGEQDKYFGETNTKNLAIESSAPIYAGYGSAMDILADGTYIDTLVKFTVTEKDTDVTADTNAKLAIWAQATDEEGTANVLKVMCGEIADGALTTVTYNLSKEGIDPEKWYRLTVRTADSGEKVDDAAVAEFTIYLDGVKLTAGEQEKFLACVTGSTIEGVGFKGNGAVDDVAITDNENAPSFAIPPLTKLTITWNTDVVTALTINGEEADASTGSAEVEPIDGVVSVSDIVCSGNYVAADQTFKADSESFEVAYVTAGVVADGTKYATLQDALAAGASAITLKAAATIADLENYVQVGTEEVAANMSIDLAGNSITATDLATPVLFYVTEGSTLSIVDSIGGGVITVSAAEGNEEFAGLFQDDGTVTIGLATDKGVKVDGLLTASGSNTTLNSGKFLASANEGLADMVTIPEGYELAEDGDYLVVKKGGDDPATYTVEITAADNTTVAKITLNEVEVETLTKAKEGDVIAVTFAADAHYTLSGEATVTVTVEQADVTIAGPEATAIVVTEVSLDKTEAALEIDGTVTLMATVTPEDALETTVTWASDNEAVATVVDGVVTAVAAGTANITATCGDASATCAVTVKAAAPALPTYIPVGNEEVAKKYVKWAETYGADTESANEEAFLLNCAPAEVAAKKLAFKFDAIVPGEMPTIEGDFNGVVVVTAYEDAACTIKGEGETATFYKAELVIAAPAK